jgi:hypothetical protein
MTEIKVLLTKETPEQIMRDAAAFILSAADNLYARKPRVVSGEALLVDTPAPLPEAPKYVAPKEKFEPGELDANGLPWDERIHSLGQVRTADGCWRRRRNVAENVVAQVEAELRRKLSLHGATLAPAVESPPPPPPPATPEILLVTSVLSAPPPPPAAAEPVASPPPPSAPAAPATVEGRSFDELMALVTDIVVGGLLSEDDIMTVAAQFDVKELADLAGAKPNTIARMYVALEEAAK